MKKFQTVIVIALFCALFAASSVIAGNGWSIKADYSESCSCNVPCPCTFGEAASKGHCDVNSFYEIEKGHLGDVDFSGINVALSGRLGNWVRFYFEEGTTKEQADAVIAVLQKDEVFGKYLPGTLKIVSVDMVPLAIEKTDNSVKFSTPNSKVEIQQVMGFNGQPVKIKNLGMAALGNHVQYKATINSYTADVDGFTYEGSNGLTSNFDLSGN